MVLNIYLKYKNNAGTDPKSRSTFIADKAEQGDLTIVGAEYFMQSGQVVFFD